MNPLKRVALVGKTLQNPAIATIISHHTDKSTGEDIVTAKKFSTLVRCFGPFFDARTAAHLVETYDSTPAPIPIPIPITDTVIPTNPTNSSRSIHGTCGDYEHVRTGTRGHSKADLLWKLRKNR
ncbi:hypothetical protein Pelo_6573 [Pelomyxa schiedti]|nr:hypothetical protein Pelo_6573 [Pelomyxa schiedti]